MYTYVCIILKHTTLLLNNKCAGVDILRFPIFSCLTWYLTCTSESYNHVNKGYTYGLFVVMNI